MDTILQISQLLGLAALAALIWLAVRAFKTHILWGLSVLLLSPIGATVFGVKYWGRQKMPFLAYITTFSVALGLGLYAFTTMGGWNVVGNAANVHQGIQSQTLTEQDATKFIRSNLDFIEQAATSPQEQKKLAVMRKFLDKFEAGMTAQERYELNREILDIMDDEDLSVEQRQVLEEISRKLQPLQQEASARVAAKGVAEKRNYRVEYVPINVADAGNYVGKTFKVLRDNGVEQQVVLTDTKPGRLQFEQRRRGGNFSFEYRNRDIAELKLLKWQAY